MSIGSRITQRRTALKMTQQALADALGVARPSVSQWEGGINSPDQSRLIKLADTLKTSVDWLLTGDDTVAAPDIANAVIDTNLTLDKAPKIPVYGQAIGGDDGHFILNGNHIADVLAPPALAGVRDAYGVLVVGDSMEPRYYAGETCYVNPRLPVRRNDFVVVQILHREGSPPQGFIKRFIRNGPDELVLDQFNPPKELRFPRNRVVSVHRIIMGGEA